MPGGGTLRVQTLRAGDEVHLRISDTGTGIPEEIMDKIFEPYFTTKPFGTGLGLTIVFKIAKEHFGDISVSSRMGEGTTVPPPRPSRDDLIDYSGMRDEAHRDRGGRRKTSGGPAGGARAGRLRGFGGRRREAQDIQPGTWNS
jgi:hypothetical protein